MLSFNIHEIAIFMKNEYRNKLVIPICTGLSGRMDKTERSVGLLLEKGLCVCTGSSPITVT